MSSWSQVGSDIDGDSGSWFGHSVSLNSDGTIMAIGGKSYDQSGNSNIGYVRVYEYSSGSWSQLGSNIVGEAANDESGYSVSLNSDGTIVAIGARHNGSSSGHVRVYEYSSGSWTQLGSDIDGEAVNDQSGYSISLNSDGTILAIGALYNDGNGSSSGHVRVYEYSSSSWSQLGSDIDGEASDDNSGYSVSLKKVSNKAYVAIGAIDTASNGYVRVYELTLSVPCFTDGTLITTTEGQKPVEELKEGDKLISANGKELTLQYITKYLAYGKLNMPIKISKSAFSLNQPSQDLFLSPNHRVPTTEGVKQAKELVNGSTITQRSDINEVYYYNLYVVEKEQNIYANDLEVNVDPVHPHAIQYYRGSEVNPKKINYKFKVNINDVFKSLI